MNKKNNKQPRRVFEFWSDKKNMEWFNFQPPSPYWVDFFTSQKRTGGKKILDLGCGCGRNLVIPIHLEMDWFACDKHPSMLAACKKKIKKDFSADLVGRLKKCEISHGLPFTSSYFHYVICHGVLHNVFSVKEFSDGLEEVGRVLKRGGFLCLNVFTEDYITGELKKTGDNLYITREGLPMVLLPSKKILALLSENGFRRYGFYKKYRTEVSTGLRSVLRGVFVKK